MIVRMPGKMKIDLRKCNELRNGKERSKKGYKHNTDRLGSSSDGEEVTGLIKLSSQWPHASNHFT